MSSPGPTPRRNPYQDPSAYWRDGVSPAGSPTSGAHGPDGLGPGSERGGELSRRGDRSPSAANRSVRRRRTARALKPVSRLATALGAMSLAFGIMALSLGFLPSWFGAVLAAGPLTASAFAGWGSFAQSKMRSARVSVMAIAGVALSALHVVMLFVR